jgi:serine/threonine protein kinase
MIDRKKVPMEIEFLSKQLQAVNLQTPLKASSHCKLSGGDIIGNYEVGEALGKGRFSTVWSGRNIRNGSVVAIKIYRTGDDNSRFYENEVKILNRIFEYSLATQTIPTNLIGYMGTFAHVTIGHDRAPRIHPCVLFNLAGDSLSDFIKFCNRNYGNGLPLPIVKKIMKDLFTGLAYLHRCNIIHTDIKPSNLLLNGRVESLDESGLSVSIGDLGSSTFADELFSDTVGTTQYIAPELIIELDYTTAIDIWSAFATCFELITGELLFDVYDECRIQYGEPMESETTDTDSDRSEESISQHYANSESSISDSSGSEDDEDMRATNYRHLFLIEKVIGPAPRAFTENARLYYNRRDKLKNNPDIDHLGIAQLLYANYDMSVEDCTSIEDFLLTGLKYIPEERITAEQALQHPFLHS